jgi:hypothetical protein
MPYPKKPRQENTSSEYMSTAPTSTSVAPVMAPRTPSATGGAPKLATQPRSLRPMWQKSTMPVPPNMNLAQAQDQLKDLSGQIKQRLDNAIKQNPAIMARNPRFFRTYQEFPDGVATMMARRAHTDQIVGSGPVADYMKFLEGLGE